MKKHVHAIHEEVEERTIFECDSCSKSFSFAHNMKKHIHTVHEGHKDHKCKSCGKSFSYASKLKDTLPCSS